MHGESLYLIEHQITSVLSYSEEVSLMLEEPDWVPVIEH